MNRFAAETSPYLLQHADKIGGRLPARAGRHRPGAVQPCRSRRALPLVRASRSARHRRERVKKCPYRRTAPRSPA
jgi:hypothetical protein